MIMGRFREGMRFLRVLTPERGLNYFRLFFSTFLSRISGVPVLSGSPSFLHIEPTNRCQLGCPECPTGAGLLTRPTGSIPLNDYRDYLDQVSRKAFYLSLYFQGEPCLHKDFITLIRLAKQRRLFTVTSTNAQCMDGELARQTVDSGLDRIIISFDGPDDAAYQSYRHGGDWEKVKQAVQRLREEKKRQRSATPVIILQCLMLRENEQKLAEVKKLARELRADRLEFKTMQVLDLGKPSPLMPSDEAKSRYHRQEGEGYRLKKLRSRSCRRIFNACVITWDGRVVPCCYDKDARIPYGDLHKQRFREIWGSAARKAFMLQVLRSRKETGMCVNCEE